MRAELFEFPITDFEELYAIIDDEKQRLHVSTVNYKYSITLDLTSNLTEQLENHTKWGDTHFNATVRKVVGKIIDELKVGGKNA